MLQKLKKCRHVVSGVSCPDYLKASTSTEGTFTFSQLRMLPRWDAGRGTCSVLGMSHACQSGQKPPAAYQSVVVRSQGPGCGPVQASQQIVCSSAGVPGVRTPHVNLDPCPQKWFCILLGEIAILKGSITI